MSGQVYSVQYIVWPIANHGHTNGTDRDSFTYRQLQGSSQSQHHILPQLTYKNLAPKLLTPSRTSTGPAQVPSVLSPGSQVGASFPSQCCEVVINHDPEVTHIHSLSPCYWLEDMLFNFYEMESTCLRIVT